MDLQELRVYVTSRYQSEATETEIDQHLNEIYRDLSRLFTADTPVSDTSVNTVVNKETYQVPQNSRRIRRVFLGAGAGRAPLRSIREDALLFPRQTGVPRRWYVAGMSEVGGDVRQSFGLDPIPNAVQALTIEYEPEPAELDMDTDAVQFIPEESQHLIAFGALAIVAGRNQDYNVASMWEQRYRAGYNELSAALGRTGISSNFPEIAKATQGAGGGAA